MATEENNTTSSYSSSQPQEDEKRIERWVSRRLQQHRSSFYQSPAGRVSPKNNYYSIPDHVINSFRINEAPDVLLTGLSVETYADYFSCLLNLEDLYIRDMSRYIIRNVNIQILDFKRALLKLPRESGKDFSPLSGDVIEVLPSIRNRHRCKGSIYRVEEDTLRVKFEVPLHTFYDPNLEYEVRFNFARDFHIKQWHREAIAEAGGFLSKGFLFPSESSIPMRIKKLREPCTVAPFNKCLNQQQLAAVTQILKCCGSPPYIVYGEKVTGTSLTITEAILQIHARDPNARILACTPFNSFSDVLLERLIGNIQQTEMFRLNNVFRPYEYLQARSVPYCLYRDKRFICPSLTELLEYKVVISTYMCVQRLLAEGVPRGHFTHIFLDLAGQASEPEAMVALAKLATTKTVVVVSGDPGDLAHHIRSPMAKIYGLEKSYLQRMIELPLYNCQNQYRENRKMFVTRLEEEYDRHSEIWEILY
eukprot:Gb_18116 [translate_table: standard]